MIAQQAKLIESSNEKLEACTSSNPLESARANVAAQHSASTASAVKISRSGLSAKVLNA